jgi:nucleoside-diphosphate-sugar epimerase
VRVLDRFYWARTVLDHIKDRVELVTGDVRSISPEVLDGVDSVVHLAGLSNDPTAEYNPDANWQMNAVATAHLADLCKLCGIKRLSYGSSCSIYDGLDATDPLDEAAPVKPRGAYSTSKYCGEMVLLERADTDFAPVILRQGTVFGYSPRMRFDLVVNTFVKDALLYGKLFLHGGGWMWRPLVDVSDVAEAHIRCLKAESQLVGGEIFNVVHGNYQIRQLAMLVAGSLKIRGLDVALEIVDAPRLVRNYRCTNHKLRERIGYEPRISVLESIEQILDSLDLADRQNLTHPRYYNIAWMRLLEEVSIILGSAGPWDETSADDRSGASRAVDRLASSPALVGG